MRILVRMPNWLGDAVMATPALANLMRHHADAEVVLVGSPAVAELFRPDPVFHAVLADPVKAWRFLPLGLLFGTRRLRRLYGPFDLAISFRNSVPSRIALRLSGATRRAGADRGGARLLLTDPVPTDKAAHQAEIYNQIVNGLLGADYEAGPTRLYVARPQRYERKTAGINPGAAYGSAKRWHPQGFARVGRWLHKQGYDLVLFGSEKEADIAGRIEAELHHDGIAPRNLAGRTTLGELPGLMVGLDLFITNDSGPMHVAGALGVPTVAIFGPTNHRQTCQWRNERMRVVRLDLDCAPCMQRTCPLKHHACMNDLEPERVLAAASSLVESHSLAKTTAPLV